jgi:hypothetical protein
MQFQFSPDVWMNDPLAPFKIVLGIMLTVDTFPFHPSHNLFYPYTLHAHIQSADIKEHQIEFSNASAT